MEIVGGVSGALLVVLLIALLLVYRNWRYEQELDSLLWKVDYKDIQMNDNDQATSNKINRVCISSHDSIVTNVTDMYEVS